MLNLVRASLSLSLLLVTGPMFGQETGRYQKVADQLIEALKAEDYERIQTLFSEGMSAAMPPAKARAFFEGLIRQRGKPDSIGPACVVPPGVMFPVRFERGTLDLKLVLNNRDQITGLRFMPLTSSKPAPEKHQTRLSLPFRGQWLVGWGGDTRELNQHHNSPSQRFAFDLLGVGEDGKTRRGEGPGNEDFCAFGRDVLAPGDGEVIKVVGGVRDNAPGSMNPSAAVGNCVMIQHREDEVSVLAHFKQGSLVVKAGDKVKRGQLLGQCGNSGNSSEPHIHYHLQNSPVLQDGLGIRCVFERVVLTKDGKTETRTSYSPVKGDIVSPD